MKIAILESLACDRVRLEALMAPFKAEGHTFAEYERTEDTDTLIRETKDAEAVIIANMPLKAAVIENSPSLRFIDVAFTGVDHVALEACRKQHITVSNASGYSNEAVAELTVGMVLSCLRKLRAVEDRCRRRGTKDGLIGSEIKGKTVGIIGLGHIGTRSAELFHAFGADILSASRTLHKDAPSYVEQTDLDTLLEKSDIVLLHCPLTPETRGLINARKLSLMKKTAILCNAARGPVVDSEALAEALKNGVIAGACLDVFDKEPPLDRDEVLLDAPNTLLTPHVAFATEESMALRAEIVFENLKAWMEGKPVNIVL